MQSDSRICFEVFEGFLLKVFPRESGIKSIKEGGDGFSFQFFLSAVGNTL